MTASRSSEELVRCFVVAIERLERDGEAEPLVRLYAADATAGNVRSEDTYRGHERIHAFWTRYRKSFGAATSRLRTVVCDDGGAALEWETEGHGPGGPFRYRGVTLLTIRDGLIARSCAYFDPAPLGRSLVADPAGRGGEPPAEG